MINRECSLQLHDFRYFREQHVNFPKRVVVVFALMSAFFDSTTVGADDSAQPVQSAQWQHHETSVLDGKRLFFDHNESQASMSEMDADATSLVPEASELKAETANFVDLRSKPSGINESVVQAGKIHYHARVEGSELIRIILNGLPCESVDRADLAEGSLVTVLNCSSVPVKEFQLQLMSDGTSVQVMNGRKLLGIITPGDSL